MIIDAIKLLEKWKRYAERGNENFGSVEDLEQSINYLKKKLEENGGMKNETRD